MVAQFSPESTNADLIKYRGIYRDAVNNMQHNSNSKQTTVDTIALAWTRMELDIAWQCHLLPQ
jgi:hypothetical protein